MTGRRIAAALLTAALSLGSVGMFAGPADAGDTTWPTFVDKTKLKPTPADR